MPYKVACWITTEQKEFVYTLPKNLNNNRVQDVLDKFKNILNIMRKHVSIVKKILCVKYGRLYMAVSYDKLWKLLIDKKMNKTQLCEKAKISTNAMARLGRNEDVRVEVLTRICLELGCSMDEILEILPEKR